MAVHSVEATRANLHGHFSSDLPPILTIDPGDTVRFQTLDAGWNYVRDGENGPELATFEPRNPEVDSGHAICGPIAIRGAEPGMTLAIKIGELRPSLRGWTIAGTRSTPLNDALRLSDGSELTVLEWLLDRETGIWRDQFGHQVPLNPFLGLIGMPPAETGRHTTPPPRPTGGNIDCKELVSGSTLYLPIAVSGGLLSCGDGHGLQGDGEVSGVAIECPMDLAELTFELLDDMPLTTPRADTPAGWLTFGFDVSLDKAMVIALDAMLDLMGEHHGFSRGEAMALSSLLVDLRITQVVNGVSGVHAVLPHGAVK